MASSLQHDNDNVNSININNSDDVKNTHHDDNKDGGDIIDAKVERINCTSNDDIIDAKVEKINCTSNVDGNDTGNDSTCLASVEWDIATLAEVYPPAWTNRNKKIIAKIASTSFTDSPGAAAAPGIPSATVGAADDISAKNSMTSSPVVPTPTSSSSSSSSSSITGKVKVSRWRKPMYLPNYVRSTTVSPRLGYYRYKDDMYDNDDNDVSVNADDHHHDGSNSKNKNENDKTMSTKKDKDKNDEKSAADTTATTAMIHWHLNFADPLLFGYYGGPLFAQDELQVSEHPVLASIGNALDDETSTTTVHRQEQDKHQEEEVRSSSSNNNDYSFLRRFTVDSKLGPTPFLIQGVPRQCSIDTTHIYGDRFAYASSERVKSATTPLHPSTITNLVAIAAPRPGYGYYTKIQIYNAFQAAYTGFRALVLDSDDNKNNNKMGSGNRIVVLNTGHWGCGAFGGNKGLMAIIQILAAGSAGIDHVCFWYGYTKSDQTAIGHAMEVVKLLNGQPIGDVFDLLTNAKYQWGVANENHVPYEPPINCILQKRK